MRAENKSDEQRARWKRSANTCRVRMERCNDEREMGEDEQKMLIIFHAIRNAIGSWNDRTQLLPIATFLCAFFYAAMKYVYWFVCKVLFGMGFIAFVVALCVVCVCVCVCEFIIISWLIHTQKSVISAYSMIMTVCERWRENTDSASALQRNETKTLHLNSRWCAKYIEHEQNNTLETMANQQKQ